MTDPRGEKKKGDSPSGCLPSWIKPSLARGEGHVHKIDDAAVLGREVEDPEGDGPGDLGGVGDGSYGSGGNPAGFEISFQVAAALKDATGNGK